MLFAAVTLFNPIPTPSMIASKHAHPIAEFLAAFTPPLTASAPPVKKPAMTTMPISSAYHISPVLPNPG